MIRVCTFVYSTRPLTATPDDRVGSPHKATQSPLSTREVIGATVTGDQSQAEETRNEVLELVFHPSDFQVTPIMDNSKVRYNDGLIFPA